MSAFIVMDSATRDAVLGETLVPREMLDGRWIVNAAVLADPLHADARDVLAPLDQLTLDQVVAIGFPDPPEEE